MRKVPVVALPAYSPRPASLRSPAARSFRPYERPAAPVAAEWPQAPTPAAGARRGRADLATVLRRPAPASADRGLRSEHNRDLRIAVAPRRGGARALRHRPRRPPAHGERGGQPARQRAPRPTCRPRAPNDTARRYDVTLAVPSFELDFWGRVKSLDEAAKASLPRDRRGARVVPALAHLGCRQRLLPLQEMEERMALTRATVETPGREPRPGVEAARRRAGRRSGLPLGRWRLRGRARRTRQPRAQPRGGVQRAYAARGRDARQPAAPAAALPSRTSCRTSQWPCRRRRCCAAPTCARPSRDCVASNANIGAARAAFLPRIGISLTAGTASRSALGPLRCGQRRLEFRAEPRACHSSTPAATSRTSTWPRPAR